MRETLGADAPHGASRSMNNRIELDHRGIKQRSSPMRGCGSVDSAARFCPAHDELRDHLRPRSHVNDAVSLSEQHRLFQERWGAVCAAPGGLAEGAGGPPLLNGACHTGAY